MAQQHKSAGDSAASGNVATTGTSSLDQARDSCPAGAFSPSAFAAELGNCTQQAYELGALIDTIHKLIGGDEHDVGRAELLAGLANRRADEFADYLCGVESNFRQLRPEVRHA